MQYRTWDARIGIILDLKAVWWYLPGVGWNFTRNGHLTSGVQLILQKRVGRTTIPNNLSSRPFGIPILTTFHERLHSDVDLTETRIDLASEP